MTRINRTLLFAFLFRLPALLDAQPYPPGFPLGARIPAISGRVVDALTGEPVANIDVTLRATSATASLGDDSGIAALRYENFVTSKNGDFRFKTSLEAEVGKPLTSLKEYWLSVNRTFLSVAQLKARPDYHGETMDSTLDDYSWDIAADPLFNRKPPRTPYGLEGPRVNNKAYFPMAAQFVRPCHQVWNANCVSFLETQSIRVALIPVLDDPEKCSNILDKPLAEQCRQLNTYRAAFRHVETIAQVRADKGLCQNVDQGGPGTFACLQSLPLYIANPSQYESRLPLHTGVDPIEQVLILRSIGGMRVISPPVLSHQDSYRETAAYSTCYYLVQESPAACVTVWWVGTEEARRGVSNMWPDGYTKGAERTEVVEGNTITTLALPKTYTALWSSADRFINIIFYQAAFYSGLDNERVRAAAASPNARLEVIRQYLQKYPASR